MYDNILNRIKELQVDAAEENSKINETSFSIFLDLVNILDSDVIKEIRMSLTPNYEIYASWENTRIECKSDGNIKLFVLPEKEESDEKE